MVKKRKDNNTESRTGKGIREEDRRARRINASTIYETCTEQLSPFGGILGLIKFIDLIGFEEIFKSKYIEPSRKTKLGNYHMVVEILMLLFIAIPTSCFLTIAPRQEVNPKLGAPESVLQRFFR